MKGNVNKSKNKVENETENIRSANEKHTKIEQKRRRPEVKKKEYRRHNEKKER